MSYGDMTFCAFYKDCVNKECNRRLTPKVLKAAGEWWGDKEGAPICQFVDKPECHKIIKKGV